MSMTKFLLCSLRERMNMMLSETIQCCVNHRDDEHLEEILSDLKDNDQLIMLLLREIASGDIESTHFTPLQAQRAIKIYEYLHDATDNEVSDCNGIVPSKDFDEDFDMKV